MLCVLSKKQNKNKNIMYLQSTANYIPMHLRQSLFFVVK